MLKLYALRRLVLGGAFLGRFLHREKHAPVEEDLRPEKWENAAVL
jgi:hypothetical protein